MRKSKIRIDVNDIVGKCLGKYYVTGYAGCSHDYTAGGPRLRHYYNCDNGSHTSMVQRGNIFGQAKDEIGGQR